MLFSSMTFLFLFLPIVFILHSITRDVKLKNYLLAAASLLFYAWGEPLYVLLMIFSIIINYIHALLIERHHNRSAGMKAKLLLISSVVINIGILGYFKYANFLVENINLVFHSNIQLTKIPLPIGISFYTFQIMSYTIDVYLKKIKAQKNIVYLYKLN